MAETIDNRYRIMEKIGAGGMGAVFLAEDIRLRRKVALKRLAMAGNPMNLDMFIKRFEREALEMASFQHTNIVSVYDYGQDQEGIYLVLEYMPGGALTDKLRHGKLPVSQATKILLPLAEALQAIHDRERVHRDIKPANILFDAYGKPKLADFGVVKLLENESGSTLTAVGTAVGTPAYMAPELIGGEASPSVDQYALAVVFYEMVTGKRPFNGRTPMETLTMQKYSPLPDPHQHNPDLPDWVCSILKKGLAKDPSQRFTSMRAFADALRKQDGSSYEEGSTIPVTYQSPTYDKSVTHPQPVAPAPSPLQHTSEPLIQQEKRSEKPKRMSPIKEKKPIPKWLPWVGVGLLGIAIMVGLGLWVMNLIGSINQQPGATQIAIAIQGTETQTNTLLPTTTGTSTPTMVPTNTPVPTPTYVVVSQMREIDQMEMVYVPAGNFIMGNDTGEADEQPVHEVYLNAFWIDKHEVTNAQYEGCVDAYICTPPLGENSYRHTNYYGSKTYAQYPVLRINWHQANNYCAWVGGRLPTEAEWEKAARGPDERLYPWGQEEPTCQLANFGGFTGCVGEVKFVEGYPSGASQYGAMDMLGNVNEWVNDWYDPGYYTVSPTEDPRGPETGENKVLRGGSFLEEKNELRLTKRYWFHPDEIPFTDYYEIGFRCVFSND